MGRNRGSFGFTDVKGKSLRVTVTRKLKSNKLVTKDAPKRLMKSVVASMNRAGRKARNEARLVRHTPKKSGDLIKSIYWKNAEIEESGGIVKGLLIADIIYARRQEYEHVTKGFFLRRAIDDFGRPAMEAELRKKKIWNEIFLGFGIGGSGFG